MGSFYSSWAGSLLLLLVLSSSLLTFGNGRNLPSSRRACSTVDTPLKGRSGLVDPYYRWKKFVVYMDESFTSTERKKMKNALAELRSILPCVKFTLTSSRPTGSYVNVKRNDKGCWSQLGRIGGRQEMNLGPECFDKGTVMHELLHALGIIHEQNRADRDDYVTIFWERIDLGWWSQYQKLSDKDYSDFGVPYNPNSIMHYPTFYDADGDPDMLTKDGAVIKESTTLQDTDILKLQRMYECE